MVEYEVKTDIWGTFLVLYNFERYAVFFSQLIEKMLIGL